MLACLALGAAGCTDCRERREVERVPDLEPPDCGGELPAAGEVIAKRRLVAGEGTRSRLRRERFVLRRRGCLREVRVRLHWRVSRAELHAVYDADLRPLTVELRREWGAGEEDADRRVLTRTYELRTDPVTVTHRGAGRTIRHWELKGGRPAALVGPGRTLLSMWIRRSELGPGGKARSRVLDFRERFETIEHGTLERLGDRRRAELGGDVRVYRVYGRDTLFTDARGLVLGDLAGFRPAPRDGRRTR